MRCACDKDNCYLDADFIFKRAHHQRDKYEILVVTSDYIIIKRKSLLVVQRIWKELDNQDRDFVVSYNRNVNHIESTDKIYVTDNFRALFKDKYSRIISSTLMERNYRPIHKTIFILQKYDKE